MPSEIIKTRLKPRNYKHSEVCRIVNPKQQLLYIKNKVYPIDIYTSFDNKTGNSIIVMIFLIEESAELFKLWCNHELT